MAGVTNLRFSCFQLADSLDAHWAGGPEFPWIFAVLADGADKEAFRSIRMKKNRIEQAASANVERNKAMCDHALQLREQGKKDHELANHIWRIWHSRNIWAQYKSKAFTTDAQVRKILKENGILASKKNTK